MNAPARAADTPTPSLRIRMLRHVMLPLSMTWLIGTVATLGVASHFTERAFDRALLDDAYSIASHVETLPGGEVGLQLTPNELKAALFDQAEAVHFSVLRADGSLLAGAQLPPVRPPQPDQAFRYGNLLHQGSVVRAVVLRHEVQAHSFYIVMAHTTRVRSELVQQMLLYGALPLLVLL
ncbi:MAG: sensor histidine kinase N-terminal domain-containing protein, partial [Hydrogenophaga sp.]|nr:sensor histidine kinase N-terminal domain-containing protein [Hydrogenophaga sp.]